LRPPNSCIRKTGKGGSQATMIHIKGTVSSFWSTFSSIKAKNRKELTESRRQYIVSSTRLDKKVHCREVESNLLIDALSLKLVVGVRWIRSVGE
jgi:hypothetical protein